MASKQVLIPEHLWYKATLTPLAQGLFTDSFYPEPKKGSGNQHVFFTQLDITPQVQKVIVVSKMSEAGIRIMTLDLAKNCLAPGAKATKADMTVLNTLVCKLKV